MVEQKGARKKESESGITVGSLVIFKNTPKGCRSIRSSSGLVLACLPGGSFKVQKLNGDNVSGRVVYCGGKNIIFVAQLEEGDINAPFLTLNQAVINYKEAILKAFFALP